MIAGVCARTDNRPDKPDLAPAPGVGQIAALVERARRAQRLITLQVDGDPGPLPASVDLGVYRILEDALASADNSDGAIDIVLQFGAELSRGADYQEAHVRPRPGALRWPVGS